MMSFSSPIASNSVQSNQSLIWTTFRTFTWPKQFAQFLIGCDLKVGQNLEIICSKYSNSADSERGLSFLIPCLPTEENLITVTTIERQKGDTFVIKSLGFEPLLSFIATEIILALCYNYSCTCRQLYQHHFSIMFQRDAKLKWGILRTKHKK